MIVHYLKDDESVLANLDQANTTTDFINMQQCILLGNKGGLHSLQLVIQTLQ